MHLDFIDQHDGVTGHVASDSNIELEQSTFAVA